MWSDHPSWNASCERHNDISNPIFAQKHPGPGGSFFVYSSLYGFNINRKCLQVFVRNIPATVPDLVYYAYLGGCFRKYDQDGIGKAIQIICTGYQNVFYFVDDFSTVPNFEHDAVHPYDQVLPLHRPVLPFLGGLDHFIGDDGYEGTGKCLFQRYCVILPRYPQRSSLLHKAI